MSLDKILKELLIAHPDLFQYTKNVGAVKIESKIGRDVVFKGLNSYRSNSFPFYKPISKILSSNGQN